MLPAQVIAFGISMIGIGLLTALVGLGWQFRQNWGAGTTLTGAPTPIFSLVPPQITQIKPVAALPSPGQPEDKTPFFSGYNLTESGVTALANELYKIKDAVSKRIDLNRMATDPTAGGLINNLIRACDQGAIDCPVGNVHPNSPTERGIMIYVADPDKPPDGATKLQSALLAVGIKVPFVTRPGFGPDTFTLFVGPAPQAG